VLFRVSEYRLPRCSATLTTGASVDPGVPEDVSLDAFDSDESDDAEPGLDESDSDELDTDDPGPDGSDPADPAVSTFDWSPESDECADCGASVERRWRAEGERDGALVCADCKAW